MLTEPDTMSIDEFSIDETSFGSLSLNGRQKIPLKNDPFDDVDLNISDSAGESFIKLNGKKKSNFDQHSFNEDFSFDLNDSLLELENGQHSSSNNSHSSGKEEFSAIFSKSFQEKSPDNAIHAKESIRKPASIDNYSFISHSDNSFLHNKSTLPRFNGMQKENMSEKMKILENELHAKEHIISQLQNQLASLEVRKQDELKKIDCKIAKEVSQHVQAMKKEFRKELERKYRELKLALAIRQSYNTDEQGTSEGLQLPNGVITGDVEMRSNTPIAPTEVTFSILWESFVPMRQGFNHSANFKQTDDEQKQISIRIYEDGSKISVHKNGLVEECYPEKGSYKRFPSGDIRKDLPNGDFHYYFRKDDVKMTYSCKSDKKTYLLRNGEKRVYFADGHVETYHPDGRIEILKNQSDPIKI